MAVALNVARKAVGLPRTLRSPGVPRERRPEEALQRRDEGDTRERNGTGAGADEDQLDITEDEIDDLEDDAEGG